MRQTTVSLVFLDSSGRALTPRIHLGVEHLGGRSIAFGPPEVKRELIVTRSLVARQLSNPSICRSPEFIACFENTSVRNEIEEPWGRS
jgi:hypothetical protein